MLIKKITSISKCISCLCRAIIINYIGLKILESVVILRLYYYTHLNGYFYQLRYTARREEEKKTCTLCKKNTDNTGNSGKMTLNKIFHGMYSFFEIIQVTYETFFCTDATREGN